MTEVYNEHLSVLVLYKNKVNFAEARKNKNAKAFLKHSVIQAFFGGEIFHIFNGRFNSN